MFPLSLRTFAKLAYVVGMLALVSIGSVNLAVKVISDVPLNGVEVSAKTPVLSFAAIRSEAFQTDAVAWFEQHWGLRGYAVRTDNTLVLRLFRETRTATVIVNRDGSLVGNEDIAYVNTSVDRADVIARAKLFARVQEKMRRRGKVLIPVIMPAKTSFFRDEVPLEWRRRGSYEASDVDVYGTFASSLKDNGVVFVDARALLLAERKPGDQIFAPPARHWRLSAACKVLQSVLDAARPELPELGAEQIDCRTRIDPHADVGADDFDLFRLLNTWDSPPRIDVETFDGQTATEPLKIPTLFVGSSFVTKFAHIARDIGVLRPSLFYYYDRSVVETGTFATTKKVEPFTEVWRADTFGKRLFILGVLETFLPWDGETFLSELDKELDSPSP